MQQDTSATTALALDFLKDFAHQLESRDIALPPFPDVYARILSALNDSDLSMDKLAHMITAAPDLCVRILLLANSALMNRAGVEVIDINVAVSRLGVTAVRNATVSIATKELFVVPKNSPLREKLDCLRSLSVKTAAYAYTLATRTGRLDIRDNAMLTGLLHNVGSFYIITKSEQFPAFADDETTHSWVPGIGSALIGNWGFPDSIARAVDEQDNVEATHFGQANLTDILIAGKLLAQMSDTDSPQSVTDKVVGEHFPALSKLGINTENISQTIEEFSDEVESFISALT